MSLVLVFGLIFSCFTSVPAFAAGSETTWDGSTIASAFSGGNGTQSNPYLISNGAELAYLADSANSRRLSDGCYFQLSADIDLGNHSWTPIGSRWFNGSFDGNGHIISGLHIDDTDIDHFGLFGRIDGSLIENLTVKGSITADSTSDYIVYVGGIAAENRDGCIQNCISDVDITGTADQIGGVCGQNGADPFGMTGKTTATIKNCTFSGTIDCTASAVGGIVGLNQKSWMDADHHIFPDGDSFRSSSPKAIVSGCYNIGNITAANEESGFSSVGGIAGESNWMISSSYNSGSIDTGAAFAGGLVGRLSGDILNCYNTGDITATSTSPYSYIGGLIGMIYTMPNGIRGLVSTIQNCYNTGDINSDSPNSGGFMGKINSDTTALDNCYYNSESVGAGNGIGTIDQESSTHFNALNTNPSIDLTGITTDKMESEAFTASLNVDSDSPVWSRSDSINNGMPVLIGIGDGESLS